MSKVGRYLARVSQEEASKAEVAITEKDATVQAFDVSEPEALDVTDLVEVCDKGQGETDRRTIDEIKHIQVALEELGRVMDSAQERGGLHPNEAAMLNVGLEHFGKRLGVTFDNPLPSMEDFGKGMTRRGALTVSQEVMIVIDKALIDKVIEIVKRMIAKAKEFLGNIDIQSAKITKAILDTKAKMGRFIRGTVLVKTRLSPQLGSDDFSHQGLEALLAAGQCTAAALASFMDSCSASKFAFQALANSEGDDAALSEFNNKMSEIWAGERNPLYVATRGKDTVQYGSGCVLHLYKPDGAGHVVGTYEFEFAREQNATGEVEVEMTKTSFSTLVNRTESMNRLVGQHSKNYLVCTKKVEELAAIIQRTRSNHAGRVLTSALTNITMVQQVSLERAVRSFANIRNSVGVFLLLAGAEFQDGGKSTAAANNTN